MLGNAIGRFFKAIVTVISFGFIKFAEPVERNPMYMGLQYDDVIDQKRNTLKQIKDAIGGLIGNKSLQEQQLRDLTKQIEDLEQERAGAQALGADKAKKLQAQGKSADDILKDPEVMQYQAAYNDASTTLEAKRSHTADLESQIKLLDDNVNNYVLQAQSLSSEVQRLQSEKHEAVADVTISRMMDDINSVAAGISSSGADDKLAQLRQRRAEAKGRAQAASVIAGTDANLQREKLRAAAQKHVQNSEFVSGLGLAQPSAPAAPVSKASAVLPEGEAGAGN